MVAASAIGLGYYYIWKRATFTPQALFESGKKYYDQKKYSEAAIQFTNALRKNPRHRDGRFLLARTYMAGGDLANAGRQLQALLEYYPDDAAANLELANIYLLGGRTKPEYYRLAQESAQRVLAKDPNNVDALVLSGAAAGALKDYDASVDTLEKATNLDPGNSNALINLGTAQALQKHFSDAEKSFIKARDANPKEARSALSLAQYYRATGDADKAEAAFKNALAVNPSDRQTYLQAADFYYRAGRFDDAEKVLQDAQSNGADNPFASLTLVNFYEMRNRHGDARKLLLDLRTKFTKNLDVAVKLATNLMPDQPDRARKEIDQIIQADPRNVLGYVLLGESQFRSGQFDAAEATLGKDPALNSRVPQVHFILGNLAVRKGQADRAVDHFQKSIAVDKAFIPAHLALAEIFLSKGNLADSRQEIGKILEIAPSNPQARLLKTTLDISSKNYTAAESELLALLKEQPYNHAILRQLGLYYAARGKNADAEKYFTRASDIWPNSEETFQDVVRFYLNTKQTAKAIQKIDSVPDVLKRAFHYELMGMAAAASGKPLDAENAYKKALGKDPNRGIAAQLLINLYVQNKRLDDAVRISDELIRKNPSNAAAVAMRGSLYEEQGRMEEAKKDFEQALRTDPNQTAAANNLAYILAEQGRDLEVALRYAQGARRQSPEDPNVADTLGWIYYKMGRLALAKDSVQFAVSKEPGNPEFQYHLGTIYKANNQRTDAENALKKAIASPTEFRERSQADAELKDIELWRHLVTPDSIRK
jgi:tetratricopeptide (TPR) repeat protein